MPTRGAAVVPGHLGPAARGHDDGGVRRARAARRGAARAGSATTGRCRPPTSSRARRSTGTGARRTRSGRSSRRSPRPASSGIARREGNRRVYDLAERLFPAELLAEPAARARAGPPQAAVALPGARPARARGGVPSCGSGPAPTRRATRPTARRAAADRSAELLAPVEVEGCAARGSSLGEELRRSLDAAAEAACRGGGGRRAATADGGAGRRVPRAARPVRVGPRPPALAVRLRLRLGGLRPGREAALGLLRPAAAVRRPARRAGSSRGSTARPGRCGSSACGGRTASTRCRTPTRALPTRSRPRCVRTWPSRTCARSRCRGSCATGSWRPRSGRGSEGGTAWWRESAEIGARAAVRAV